MKNIPEQVSSYVSELELDTTVDGYACLGKNQNIISSAGWVGNIDLTAFDPHQDLAQSIPMLEGLLPATQTTPTVIHNAHIDKDWYFDIHVFGDSVYTYVVFVDKTRSGKLQQQEQQIRLADDYENDKKRQSNG